MAAPDSPQVEHKATWARVAETQPEREPEATVPTAQAEPGKSLAVLDASAIIGAVGVEQYAQALVTTAEVYAECRDKQSQQVLANLPFGITVQEPTESSVAAVTRFARSTGDVHSLSVADIRLIALAHTLEVAAHGAAHLRSEPTQARAIKKGSQGSRQLPGWGDVGGNWAEMDQMDEEELAAAEKAQGASATSRIAAELHNLSLSAEPKAESDGQVDGAPSVQDAAGARTATSTGQPGDDACADEDDGEWETAAASQNAARRRRRKQARRAARSAAGSHLREDQSTIAPSSEDQGSEAGEDEDDDANAIDQASPRCMEGQDVGDEEASETCSSSQSNITIVTADFAMQNVILQMGLTLVAPNGHRIQKLSLWVLRCSACFKVTKEMEHIFCPSCGNAALQKVEMIIGQDGAEQYGVRKKHIIRGTRYSLPKPKGGKNSKDPILREDMLMLRMPKRKPKVEQKDPFAPEYNMNTWFDKGRLPSGYEKGLAATIASWKHNPNERQHARTNRRK